jgi:hypothetical protein
MVVLPQALDRLEKFGVCLYWAGHLLNSFSSGYLGNTAKFLSNRMTLQASTPYFSRKSIFS